jgi:hypothetical protein
LAVLMPVHLSAPAAVASAGTAPGVPGPRVAAGIDDEPARDRQRRVYRHDRTSVTAALLEAAKVLTALDGFHLLPTLADTSRADQGILAIGGQDNRPFPGAINVKTASRLTQENGQARVAG